MYYDLLNQYMKNYCRAVTETCFFFFFFLKHSYIFLFVHKLVLWITVLDEIKEHNMCLQLMLPRYEERHLALLLIKAVTTKQ